MEAPRPLVIAVRNASIGGLSSVMNVVIMIAVRIIGNSLIHSLSRTLAALADRGQAPKILGYVDWYRRPAERRDGSEQGIMASFGKLLHQDQGIVERHWSMSWKTICRLRVREGEALKDSRP
jgi:hypothetical protein